MALQIVQSAVDVNGVKRSMLSSDQRSAESLTSGAACMVVLDRPLGTYASASIELTFKGDSSRVEFGTCCERDIPPGQSDFSEVVFKAHNGVSLIRGDGQKNGNGAAQPSVYCPPLRSPTTITLHQCKGEIAFRIAEVDHGTAFRNVDPAARFFVRFWNSKGKVTLTTVINIVS